MSALLNLPDVDKLIDEIWKVVQAPSLFSFEELGVIPSPWPTSSPTPTTALSALVKTPRHFALHSWSLNPLYMCCKHRLSNDRTDHQAATVILTVNPDFTTAWNIRKSFLKLPSLSAEKIQCELHFSSLLLTRAPKSGDTWSHRYWLLLSNDNIDVEGELNLAWMAASRAFSNYYATVHRVRLFQLLGSEQLDSHTLNRELHNSRKWIATHVGDSSGWTYHRLLIRTLHSIDALDVPLEVDWFAKMKSSYESSYQNVSVHTRWLNTYPMIGETET